MLINCYKKIFLLICLCLISGGVAFAQNNDDQKTPSGTEIVQIDGQNILVPVGTIVTKKGSLIQVEDVSSYMSRHLLAIEDRLTAIESKLDNLQKETEYLQNRKTGQATEKRQVQIGH